MLVKFKMVNIVFVCHGNICRSPMAEYVMRDLVEKKGLSCCFNIISRATSYEEHGNSVHYGTVKKLSEHGISCFGKRAEVLTGKELKEYDYIFYMDRLNLRNIERIARNECVSSFDEVMCKVSSLKAYTGSSGDVADPWYTGNFDETWDDIYLACTTLVEMLAKDCYAKI